MKREFRYSGGGSEATVVKPDVGDLVLSNRGGYVSPVLTLLSFDLGLCGI